MPATLVLFAFATFAAATVAAYVVLEVVFSEDRRVSRRLKGLTEYEMRQARQAEPMLRSFWERVVHPAVAGVAAAAKGIWPANYTHSLRRRLERAGYPRGLHIERFIAAKVIGAAGVLLFMVAVSLFSSMRLGAGVFLGVLASVLAFFAPDVWLDGELKRRQAAIVRQLPDTLDLLTISVEAGMGFDAALSRIVKRRSGPLAEEFGRVLQEVQAGSSRKDALRSFAERVDMPEISAFVTAIVQADVFGVSIAQVLRTQAVEMRTIRRQRAEEMAQKTPVKMVIPLIFCILPATMIVILGPAVIRIGRLFGG